MANLWKKIKIRFNKYKTRMLAAVFAVVPSFSSELPHRELREPGKIGPEPSCSVRTN